MHFEWIDYLLIAEKLRNSTKGKLDNGNNQALRRTAISRAYYAVHHIAVFYAEKNFDYKYSSKRTGSNSQHSDICTEYKAKSGNPDYQEVGQILRRLLITRKKCDYDENIDVLGNLDNLLETTILDANKIVKTLS